MMDQSSRPRIIARISWAVLCCQLLLLSGPARIARATEPEPVHNGKPLSYWVKRAQYKKTFTLNYHDDGHRERAEAFAALTAIGPPAVAPLRGLLKHEYWSVRFNAVNALGGIGAPAQAAVPDLLKLLANLNERDVRQVVPMALARIDPRSDEVRQVLLRLFEDRAGRDGAGEGQSAGGQPAADNTEAEAEFFEDQMMSAMAFLALEECRKAGEFSAGIIDELKRLRENNADPQIRAWAGQLLELPKPSGRKGAF